MAIFGNYVKPGSGVSEDTAQKKALFRFFETFGRKFWDLVKMNMLYFVCIFIFYIPLSLCLYTLSRETDATVFKSIYTYLFVFLYALPVVLTGPFTAGYTYILRNFVKEEPSFLWSDYIGQAKSNLKQSLAAAFLNLLIFMVLIFNICFYFIGIVRSPYMIFPLILCILAFFIFLFMNYYIYVIMVTFKLKLSQIYKNAMIFSLMGFGRNVLVTVILALLVLLHWQFLYESLLLVPFISLSFAGLLINFAAWPKVKKYMIDPYDQGDQEEAIFKDHNPEA